MEHNERFQIPTDAEAYFLEHFALPTQKDEGQWLSAAAIIEHIKQQAHSSFQAPSVAKMGRILSRIPVRRDYSLNAATYPSTRSLCDLFN